MWISFEKTKIQKPTVCSRLEKTAGVVSSTLKFCLYYMWLSLSRYTGRHGTAKLGGINGDLTIGPGKRESGKEACASEGFCSPHMAATFITAEKGGRRETLGRSSG
ncbi:hypothetical protein CISG_05559 [Coccidioides immitis RMSCC 3703]|uniref:Uncharacterized protein n=1 Tax=Coccidioides immitis RMSCC 3703 TaxID=454286 RepID=A0A0J8QUP5_COCIT|nr:hypothetical protein CISG_05559 [Coccidioides immitis RMSCC 3703]